MSYLISPHPLLFQSGDRMAREEFLERWERMPELKNAELLDGVVYMPSPVSLIHSKFDSTIHFLLRYYAMRTTGCECLSNATWMMLESAPQPDSALRILPEYGGRTSQRDSFVAGAPELAVEVTLASRSYDLGPKQALYQRAGVQESVAVLMEEWRIEWRVLEDGSYRLMPPDPDDIFRSHIFPGLWLNQNAFWRGNDAGLLAVLEQGLTTEEHSRFVETLSGRLSSGS